MRSCPVNSAPASGFVPLGGGRATNPPASSLVNQGFVRSELCLTLVRAVINVAICCLRCFPSEGIAAVTCADIFCESCERLNRLTLVMTQGVPDSPDKR